MPSSNEVPILHPHGRALLQPPEMSAAGRLFGGTAEEKPTARQKLYMHVLGCASVSEMEAAVKTGIPMEHVIESPTAKSAWMVAAAQGDLDVMQLLRSENFDMHIIADCDSPLSLQRCHLNVNRRDTYKGTALHIASAKGHTKIVQFLLDNGADRNLVDAVGGTALMRAAKWGHLGPVRHLVNELNVNEKNNFLGTALHAAAGQGHIGIVRVLLANKANIDDRDVNGNTAFMWATKGGHTDIMELLKNGDRINEMNLRGETPFHIAAAEGQIDALRLLMSYGAEKKKQKWK